MHFGHFSAPPKEHSERKPFQAFAGANKLRKANAAKHGFPNFATTHDRRQAAKTERTWRHARALMFLVLFTMLVALVAVATR